MVVRFYEVPMTSAAGLRGKGVVKMDLRVSGVVQHFLMVALVKN